MSHHREREALSSGHSPTHCHLSVIYASVWRSVSLSLILELFIISLYLSLSLALNCFSVSIY